MSLQASSRLAGLYSFVVRDSTITRLLSLCLHALSVALLLSHTAIATTLYELLFYSLSHPLPSFLYPKAMLHLRVVGQSLPIIIRSGRITSSRECQRLLSRLSFVLDVSASPITSF
jgi:hypothetical protein